jgi:hypothetical protein
VEYREMFGMVALVFNPNGIEAFSPATVLILATFF